MHGRPQSWERQQGRELTCAAHPCRPLSWLRRPHSSGDCAKQPRRGCCHRTQVPRCRAARSRTSATPPSPPQSPSPPRGPPSARRAGLVTRCTMPAMSAERALHAMPQGLPSALGARTSLTTSHQHPISNILELGIPAAECLSTMQPEPVQSAPVLCRLYREAYNIICHPPSLLTHCSSNTSCKATPAQGC